MEVDLFHGSISYSSLAIGDVPSPCKTLLHVLHKALRSAALERQFGGSASNTKADSEGRVSERQPYAVNRLSCTPVAINVAWLWWSTTT